MLKKIHYIPCLYVRVFDIAVCSEFVPLKVKPQIKLVCSMTLFEPVYESTRLIFNFIDQFAVLNRVVLGMAPMKSCYLR